MPQLHFNQVAKTKFFKVYRLIVERSFALPSDPNSYVGGSVSCWYWHPCQTGQRVWTRRNELSTRSGIGSGANYPTPENLLRKFSEPMWEAKPHIGSKKMCRKSLQQIGIVFITYISNSTYSFQRSSHCLSSFTIY
jgi:hypothetical protein